MSWLSLKPTGGNEMSDEKLGMKRCLEMSRELIARGAGDERRFWVEMAWRYRRLSRM